VVLEYMLKVFIDSRKRGTTGARKKCTERTLEIYRYNLGMFFDWLQKEHGVAGYKDIARLHIVQFLDWLEAKEAAGEWKRATTLQMLRCLRTFFRWVDKDEECQDANLRGVQRWLPMIEKCPRRTDIPQIADIKSFKNSFNTSNKWGYRNYVATCLLINNGIRIGELCNLKINDVQFEDKKLIVSGKTGTRLVPFTDDVGRLLKGWLKRRQQCGKYADSPYLFISKRSEKMDPNAFQQAFRKHRLKAGLPRISAHTFRHVFCTNYLKKGGDIAKLQTVSGHSSMQMLSEYLHLAKLGSKSVQDEMERVNLLKEL
jgi:integrase/recombinase XerD